MTAKTAPQYKEVYDALCAGETIQCRNDKTHEWQDIDDPSFDSPPACYRIKPKPREVWIGKKANGSLSERAFTNRDAASLECGSNNWTPTLFREVLP